MDNTEIKKRSYQDASDIARISGFLNSLYKEKNSNSNSLAPFWEYSCTHSFNNHQNMKKVGIWEERDKIVGVVFYDIFPSDVLINVAPEYHNIQGDMLRHIEENFRVEKENKELRVYTSDQNIHLSSALKTNNYHRCEEDDRVMFQNKAFDNLPNRKLPEGFKIISLEDEFDIFKISRLLHRGFNNEGEMTIELAESNRVMFSGENFRKELAIVIVSPDGDYAAYSCLLFEPINKYGYIEPVATDPNYRRMGLASIAIMEGIKRCNKLGANDIYVGSGLPVYKKLGFQKLYTEQCWCK